MKYCYSNYGTAMRIVADDYTAASGEVLFTTTPTPTTAQLSAAFPSTAAVKTVTITKNAVAADTITIAGATLTAGTSFTVGDNISDTVANIVVYLKTLPLVTGKWNITSSGSAFTLTERFAGGGLTLADATYTGTVVISNGTATTSVWGYTTQTKHTKKLSLETEAESIRDKYRKNYIGALSNGNTTLASAILTSMATLNTNLYSELEAVNDE